MVILMQRMAKPAQTDNLGVKGITFANLWKMGDSRLLALAPSQLATLQRGLEARERTLKATLPPREFFFARADNRVAELWVGRIQRTKAGEKPHYPDYGGY